MDNHLQAVAILHDGIYQVHDFEEDLLTLECESAITDHEIVAMYDNEVMVVGEDQLRLVISPGTAPESLLDDVGRALLFARYLECVSWQAAMAAMKHAYADGLSDEEIAVFLRLDVETVTAVLDPVR